MAERHVLDGVIASYLETLDAGDDQLWYDPDFRADVHAVLAEVREMRPQQRELRDYTDGLREDLREIDPAKLDLLADWFDMDDARKGSGRGVGVQADLRRWAKLLRELGEDASRF